MDIIIRFAEKKDIDSLVGLLYELFEIEEDFAFDEERQRQGLGLIIGSEKNCVLVAEYGKKVVGMCNIQTLISTAEGGHVGLIEDMIVTKDYARKGIGRSLLTKAEEWGVKQGLTRFQLSAGRNNAPALAFYRKLGWSKTKLIGLRKSL
jgi:ribosomal protein S18 acetylase RimI-like enzyme